MSRVFSMTAAAGALTILFACSQQASDAQDQAEAPPAPAEDSAPADTPETGNESTPSMMRATGDILGAEGSSIGSVNLLEGPNGLLVEVNIEAGSLEPGWHGMHFHQTGDCSDTGVFKASGGHVGKIDGGHGLLNPDGPEPADLPNIYAFDDGSAHTELFTDLVGLSQILDEDGGAMVIHENRDDHMSQPIGGAGARVACAVIE